MSVADAGKLPKDARIEADVCIVGAGAAGIAIARALRGSGLQVALLESGGLGFEHRTQFLYLGELAGQEAFSTVYSRFRQFGGSTTRWGGQCRPFDAADFERRDGVPWSGWPFGLEELVPWYRAASAVCNLSHAEFSPEQWASPPDPMLPLVSEHVRSIIFQFGHPRDFGAHYRSELFGADDVAVWLHANVVELQTDASGSHVQSALVRSLNGRSAVVTARTFILACGGIENARLLLASNAEQPGGLGNRHDLVGRFFMDHPYCVAGHFEPRQEAFDRTLYAIEDYERTGSDQKANAAFALHEHILRDERLNNCSLYFVRRAAYKTDPPYFSRGGRSLAQLVDVLRHREVPDRHFPRHLLNIAVGAGDVGRVLLAQARQRLRPVPRLALRAVVEATPNRDSRVTLTERRDALGMRRVRVDWRVNPTDRRGLARLLECVGSEVERLALGRLALHPGDLQERWPESTSGGKHHMGTTRMHEDPREGVVDPDCRVHGLPNLYIAGSSVFPTGGAVNPTLTLVALALRLADHVRAELSGGRAEQAGEREESPGPC